MVNRHPLALTLGNVDTIHIAQNGVLTPHARVASCDEITNLRNTEVYASRARGFSNIDIIEVCHAAEGTKRAQTIAKNVYSC